ncbi:MAG: integrase family protein [Betaproteobacteria bacterium]|nr:integrase family protein [Betaproteobacteria bacterium]
MGKRDNFTADRVASFRCEAGRQQSIYWDGKTPGLGLRVTAKGAKSYIFETRLHGKTLRMTVGDVRTWAIGKAQAEATRLKALTDQGIDPRQILKEQAAAIEAKRAEQRRQDVTVGEAWAIYLDARKVKWSPRHLWNLETLAKEGGQPRSRGRKPTDPMTTRSGPLYPLLALRLPELDADAVGKWLDKEIKRGPGQADQAYRALKAFIGWCAEHKEYGPATHANACTTKEVREKAPTIGAKKNDSLQREQLRSWFEAVKRINNPVISAYLQGLLLTGARREELASLTWDGLDFQWRSLTIHDKVEGERTIPLTPYLASLLATLPRRKDKSGKPLPWVFSSPTAANGRIQEPRIQHVKALAAAGLPHVSLHGLRRSFGSLTEWVECPVGIVAQIMGHKPSALAEKHYRERPLDLLRMWHDKIEAWMLEQAGIEFQPEQAKPGLRVVA